jgi:glycosyltransferase involved in cell wall biosynthesis
LRRSFWLNRQNFDLIHAFDTRPVAILPALYLRSRQRIPLVLDWGDWFGRGGSVEERPNAMVRMILRPVETFFEEHFRTWADGTTVICSTLRHKAINLGVPPETILLVHDGTDTEGLQPLEQHSCRQILGLPQDAPIVGYVGAIFYRDAQLMAQAFDQLQAVIPSARLLLIGYVNFPIEEMVETRTAVIRTGLVSYTDINHYLAACDVCWLPLCDSGANRGRWPMKLNDYMAVGRPTVATAVGDTRDVMQTHDIGLLTRDTPEDMAQKTLALLANPDNCLYLGRRARQAAEEVFDWQFRTTELEMFYEQVLSKSTHLAQIGLA